MMPDKRKILYVEDEQFLMGGLIDLLSLSYTVITARNADQAIDLLEREAGLELILLDVMLPEGQKIRDPNRGRTAGLELVKKAKEKGISLPIICYTVVMDEKVLGELNELGATIISKAMSSSHLLSVIKDVIEG